MGAKNSICQYLLCSKSSENEQARWKNYFIQECKDLKDVCEWPHHLHPFAQRLIEEPSREHTQEVQQLKQVYAHSLVQKTSVATTNYPNHMGSLQVDDHSLIKQKSQAKDVKLLNSIVISVKEGNENEIENDNDPKRLTYSNNDRSSHTYTISSQTYLDNITFKKEQNLWSQESREEVAARINYFTKLTRKIKLQMKDKSNQLCQLSEAFFYFIEQYKDESFVASEKSFHEVQQFSRVLWQTAVLYYDLNDIKLKQQPNSFFVNDDDMLGFFVSLVVSNDQVYRILFDNLSHLMKEQVEANSKRIIDLEDVTTQQCDINQAHRLDISTYYYLKHKFPTQVTKEYMPVRPYKVSIGQLQKIVKKHSSSSKIKCILKTQESILKSIKNFYKTYDVEFDGILDSDNLISIQIYILIKAQILDIEVHLKLIEKFATNKVSNGTAGYYVTSLLAACDYLQEIDRLRTIVKG